MASGLFDGWSNSSSSNSRSKKKLRRPSRHGDRLARRRLLLESLEDRRVLATFYVDNSPGSGGTEFTATGGTQPASVPGLVAGVNIFSTIQDAVNAASATDTINVADGTYTEAVNVNKTLTIQGNQFGVDARNRVPTSETVLNHTSGAFLITSNNSTVDGFTAQGQTNTAFLGFGFLLGAGFSGHHVLNNIIQNNVAGLSLANSGANQAVIRQNLFFQNNNVPLGPVSGTAIYTDQFNAGGALANVLIDNNAFTGNNSASVNLGSSLPGSQSNITVSNNTFTSNGNGVVFSNTASSSITNNTFTLSVGSQIAILDGSSNIQITGNVITGGGTRGIRVDAAGGGPSTGIVAHFNLIQGNAINGLEVAAGAHTGPLDATCNWWGDITGPTTASNPGGTGQIVTDPSGVVDFQPWLVYSPDSDPALAGVQVATSFTVPAQVGGFTSTNNNYRRLVNAIDCLLPGQTVTLSGNFDWTEANAQAAWAVGNNAVAGGGDDYSLRIPSPLNNVTLTAAAPLGAHIQGPGDLATVNQERFLNFQNTSATSSNQNWTISNLQISGFDIAIGMFTNGGNSTAFSGTSITNNLIQLPNDLNSVVAPADPGQNIGIHYSFGANQTIVGNTIEIPGDGVSDPSGDLATNRAPFSNMVGLQSNTSGGTVYDGLQISGNTIKVLNAQDNANPQRIIGFWDNAHAHSSDISISGNTFQNLSAGNDPSLNRQQAFWVTSHSSGSTTVSYANNVVSGASIGFKWLGNPEFPSNFSGNQPVQMTGNTVTGSQTGILLQSSGVAHFAGNDFDGATDNHTDIRIVSEAVPSVVTFGAGNQFAGEAYFIQNLASLPIIVPAGNLFDQANSFRITDRMLDALDNAASGLVRFDGANLYVSAPGTGASDESIARAVAAAAASGDTIHIEEGTYAESVNTAGKSLTVAPGSSPGQVAVGGLTLGNDDTLVLELDGPNPATDFDNFLVTGSVTLGGATLSLDPSVLFATGTQLTIVANDGADPVSGTFAGLPEGALVTTPMGNFFISYAGNDGNDVVLSSEPIGTGTPGNDTFLLTGNGTVFQLVINGGAPIIYNNPLNITINGLGGADTLTVDFINGQPIPVGGVVYSGGSGLDGLGILARGTNTIYRPDSSLASLDPKSGTLEVGGRTISFTGLEPIDIDGGGGAVLVQPTGANDDLALATGLNQTSAIVPAGTQAAIVISGNTGGGSFETAAVWNASTLTVDTTAGGVDGIDTIALGTVTGSGLAAIGNLTVQTGLGGGDMIDVNGAMGFAGNVTLDTQQIDFNVGGAITAASVVLDAGSGPITDGDLGNDVTATSLTATATSGISLDTSVANLIATNLGAGTISLREANAVTLTNVANAGGSISITTVAAGNVTVENVNAGASNVTMLLADGDLVSGAGDAGVADIVGNSVTLDITAGNNNYGVSPANRLELNAVTLHASVVGAGSNDAFIVDLAGGVTMNISSINANAGNEYNLLVLNGSLLSSNAPATMRDIGAHIIVLQVTGAGSTIGTAALPFEINAATTNPNGRVDASTAGGAADHIFISDLSDNLPVGFINAGLGNVTLRSTMGAITDANLAANNVTANNLALRALTGIGSGNALETAVSSLSAENSTSGNIEIANSVGGLLTLTNLAPVTAGFAVRNLGGGVTITNASPLTVAANVSASGAVTLTAADSAAAGDDLTVNTGITVQSTGSSVTLNAGDNASIGGAGTLLSALTTLTINIDSGNLDAGVGATLTIPAAADIDAASASFNGGTDNDTFNIAPDGDGVGPDQDTPITVNGNAPVVAPGDVLNLDITGLGIPTLLVGPGPNDGLYSFGGLAASVTYTSIETVNTGGGTVNLIIDTEFLGFQNGAADLIFVRLDAAGTNLLVDVNGTPVFSGAAAGVNSLTVIGSDDGDTLQIDETAGGLPQFAGQTPSVDNTLVGGGTANPSHLNASADLVLSTVIGGTWDATDVTFHFDGRSGVDAVDLNLSTSHSTAYTSDTLDGANSGNLGTTGGGGPDFLMSFANLAPLNLDGAGGILLVDATSTPATTNLTLSDDVAPGDGWSQVAGNGGFETTRFRDYDQLLVVGGEGSELVDMVGLDVGSSLGFVQLHGGNTADLLNLGVGNDVASDTVRVQSTLATTLVVVDADAGDDLVRLFDAANTVDNILAPVSVTGDAGNDTLTVVDSGDLTGDSVFINQNSIIGNTGSAGGPDILYSNIDLLNVTTTSGADELDATFAPGSDLDTVNLSGWTGADQFYLSTTDEAAGSLAATGIQTINLFGDTPGNTNDPDGNDIFGQSLAGVLPGTPQGLGVRLIRPSVSTLINIDGGKPTAAPNPPVEDQVGDMLNLDVSALAPPVIVATLGGLPSQPGVAQSIAAPPSHRPVNFVEIEDINLDDEGILTDVEMGDLYVRGSENADSVQFLATANPNVARVRVNAYQNYFTITRRTVVYGRGGNDYIQMGNFNHPAEFYGEEGDDYLAGYLANDKLVGGFGRDRINASGGNNVVWGDRDPVEAGLEDSEANRQLIASETSGNRSDTLDADILSTLDGNDTMYGGPGPDSMTLGGGADYAYGGLGNDSIALGAGDDRGYGGDGNDTITGSGGNDLINGGNGNDGLNGGEGLDVLIGGGGNDGLTGDNGNDLLFDGRVTYNGVSDNSQTIGDANDVAMAQLLADWVSVGTGSPPGVFTNDHDGVDQVRGNGGADSFSAGAADIFDFELGIDTILP